MEEPKITRVHSIGGYRLVKEIKKIETAEYDEENTVRENMKIYAKQLGGNAIFDYWYEPHRRKKIAGYSDQGNKYYKTVVTYSGEGLVVLIEPTKRVTYKNYR